MSCKCMQHMKVLKCDIQMKEDRSKDLLLYCLIYMVLWKGIKYKG